MHGLKKISSNPINLHYEMKGEGEVLLFLHGLGSSVEDWSYQLDYFSADYRVMACDLRGHGKSERPATYSIELMARDVEALLDRLQIDSVCIIGISLGGMVAQELALRAPLRVNRLVLVNTMPYYPKPLWALLKRGWLLRFRGLDGMAAYLGPRLFPRPELAVVRSACMARFMQNDIRAYCGASMAVLRWSARKRLSELGMPVTLIASTKDYWPPSEKRKAFRTVPNLRVLELPEAHHLAPVECPEPFNALLARALTN